MPPNPLELFLFLNQLQISSAEKNTPDKNEEIMPPLFPRFYKISCLATAGCGCRRKNPIIGFGPPTLEMLPPSLWHFCRNIGNSINKQNVWYHCPNTGFYNWMRSMVDGRFDLEKVKFTMIVQWASSTNYTDFVLSLHALYNSPPCVQSAQLKLSCL